jgi:hypothetical protein
MHRRYVAYEWDTPTVLHIHTTQSDLRILVRHLDWGIELQKAHHFDQI